ncbi:MAG: ergothioneine biosynthesis protein EgtB [Rudaea sp.]
MVFAQSQSCMDRAAPVVSTPAQRYGLVRDASVALCDCLQPEDTVVQSMPDASPTKWHLAHTTWFFEQFLLGRDAAWRPLHAQWNYLFNSYYQTVGPMHARPQRGLLTRPTLAEVLDYRRNVDEHMVRLLDRSGEDTQLLNLLDIGLNHEQQHQELLLTDIKHLFWLNPLLPAFRSMSLRRTNHAVPEQRWLPGHDGIVEIGHAGDGFAFDNETPRHRTLLQPHAIARRTVTNAEFAQFIADQGYATPTLWMAEAWDIIVREGLKRPLYWAEDGESEFTLHGQCAIDPNAPVAHVSFYEAHAFARWAGARLPTEAEWECQAQDRPIHGNFADSEVLQPRPATHDDGAADAPLQLFGNVWEWTSSPYVNYPGYRPLPGALGEYNGKFMCGQWVLRGGSCATPAGHIRASYRNFFYPSARWQFAGIRLAKDA